MNEPKSLALTLTLSDGEAVGGVCARLKLTDLDLPLEEFCERFLRPAYKQAEQELRYFKEKTA